jgi:hypothetical protein
VIRIGTAGAEGALQPDELERLTRQFSEQRAIRLPGLLEPPLLDVASERAERAPFQLRTLDGLGRQLAGADPVLEMMLLVALNRPPLYALLEAVTGRSPVRGIEGGVYRLAPGTGHELPWHDDGNEPGRLLGFSLHLGRVPYEGGLFQLRARSGGPLFFEIANTGLGDAVVFAVDAGLEHRVTPVEGRSPRTAFAGWAVDRPASTLGARPRAT